MNRITLFCLVLIVSAVSFAGPRFEGDEKLRAFAASVQEETAKNYPRAIQGMLDIREAYRTDYLVHVRLGWLYYLSKDYDTSVKYYQEAIRLSDQSIEALLGITLPYAELKKWDNVQETYKTILVKDKCNYTANLRMGQIFFNLGNYVMARKYFDTVLDNYPGDYEINLYAGWNYYYLGSRTKARLFFVNAVAVNAADTSARKGLDLTK